jgi:hypothetical protein
MLNVANDPFMKFVVMLSVIMLNVVAPFFLLCQINRSQSILSSGS